MSQSKRHSLQETLVSTGVGLVASTLLNMIAVPLIVGAPVNMRQNLTLTAMFTVASILRGYWVRRHFNRKQVAAAK